MEELKEQIAEILDIDIQELDLNKKFNEYDSWDSLAALSLISLADTDFDKTINRKKLLEFPNIEAFCTFLTD